MEDTQTELVIFQEAGQPVQVRLDAARETVWLSQRQIKEMTSGWTMMKATMVRREITYTFRATVLSLEHCRQGSFLSMISRNGFKSP